MADAGDVSEGRAAEEDEPGCAEGEVEVEEVVEDEDWEKVVDKTSSRPSTATPVWGSSRKACNGLQVAH